jgi:hypothetical protein
MRTNLTETIARLPPPLPADDLPPSLAAAIAGMDRYPSGAPRSITLTRPVAIETPLGGLVPNHRFDDARAKYAPSVTFHGSGGIKSLRLSAVTMVATPLGPLPAERLTFYENGALKRLFPVDGRLSGFWSIADEKKLNHPITLPLKTGPWRGYVSALAFHPSGELKSVTLWPGEDLTLPLPLPGQPARVGAGFSLYPSGDLASLEPKSPVPVATPLGPMWAYDPEATGVTADRNSLAFGPDGQVTALKSLVTVTARAPQGPVTVCPQARPHPLEDDKTIHRPLAFAFHGRTISVSRQINGEDPVILDARWPISLTPYLAGQITGISLSPPRGRPNQPLARPLARP